MVDETVVIGVDPGASGGFARVGGWGSRGGVLFCCPLPVREVAVNGGIERWLDGRDFVDLLQAGDEAEVWVEMVVGRGGWRADTNFLLGGSFHSVRSICELLGNRVHLVRPQTWRKWYGLDTKKADKAESVRLARVLWPDRNFKMADDGIAEACLIAAFGLDVQNGRAPDPGVLGDVEEVRRERAALAKLKRLAKKASAG